EEGARLRRALPHHVRHVDPGGAALRACAPYPSRFRRGLGERQPDLPRRALGAAADHREHRHRRRDRPDHEAAVRGTGDRLRDGEDHRVHVHPRRHRRDARNRHLATRNRRRGRRHGRVYARGDQGLDVHAGGGWVVGWGNGLILGYMMYRSQLVPRPWPWLGMIGGPLIILSGTVIMFGGNHPRNGLHILQGTVSIPEILWELFLGVYCTIWGFRRGA